VGEQQFQLILGSLMGDGSLSPNRRDRSGTRFPDGARRQAGGPTWTGRRPCWGTSRTRGRSTRRVPSSLTSPRFLSCVSCTRPFISVMVRSTSAGTTSRASRPWRWRSGTWTTVTSPLRSKGVQERTAGGTGRIEICVEAMSPGSRERLARYLRDTHGLQVSSWTAGRGR